MKIVIKLDPVTFDDDYIDCSYACNSEIDINEESNIIQYMSAICKALEIEGFSKSVIAQGMNDYSDYLCDEYDIKLKEEEKLD